MTWWTNELGYAYQSERPLVKPTYTDVLVFELPTPFRMVHASPPAHRSTRLKD